MFRTWRRVPLNIKNKKVPIYIQNKTFLTQEYKCNDAWNAQISSSVLGKVNLNDFYILVSQNHSSKGIISPVDVDIFANAVKDPVYLEELKDLLHKLRLSAETRNTLESTHHATIRNFLEYGTVSELLEILKDPLNFGIFLDHFAANILLDKLLVSENYEDAATVASLVMLQEDYNNDITCALCQYACYMHINTYTPPPPPPEQPPPQTKSKKVEEIKIRVKYLRNPYFDDHFDIKDPLILSGKTLAWISERANDNLNSNLQIVGWLLYKKYDKLLATCEKVVKSGTFKVFTEIKQLLEKENNPDVAAVGKCLNLLEGVPIVDGSLTDSLKDSIENAINKSQLNDISAQKEQFQLWEKIREDQLEEQSKLLNRAKRLQLIEEKQKQMKLEEQKLWFFENEEKIDLEIEGKEQQETSELKVKATTKTDDSYIPPEIVPKRR